ncbi:MAG: type II toxin-antitoxin system Phd/YefM family antitoxin [Gammaproteobacteria bacterium]
MVSQQEQPLNERRIGIRELKSKLSQCVREVKMGATIIVTEHGRRVARLIPEAESLGERVNRLRSAASIQWSGRRLGRAKPVVRMQVKQTVADIIVKNRE